MEELLAAGIVISWAGIGYLWYQQRNQVSSERHGDRVVLRDKKGIIKRNIISE